LISAWPPAHSEASSAAIQDAPCATIWLTLALISCVPKYCPILVWKNQSPSACTRCTYDGRRSRKPVSCETSKGMTTSAKITRASTEARTIAIVAQNRLRPTRSSLSAIGSSR
jgi:hypothetical protein